MIIITFKPNQKMEFNELKDISLNSYKEVWDLFQKYVDEETTILNVYIKVHGASSKKYLEIFDIFCDKEYELLSRAFLCSFYDIIKKTKEKLYFINELNKE